MANIGAGTISKVRLAESAAPATPASGYGYLYEKSDGKLYFKNDGGTEYDLASGGGGLYSAYLHYKDQKAQSTSGGTFTNGAWRTRDLTTEVADTAGIGSLASNQITLPAGTYRAMILAPAYRVDTHQARLRDVTNGVTLLPGTVGYSANGADYASSVSFVMGRFTLAGTAALEVQHICFTSKTTNGFGNATTLDVEIYTVVELFKE